MRHIIYTALQCTWGLPQTMAGLVLFLRNRGAEHAYYHGSVLTRWNRTGGISLGLFIFVQDADTDGRMAVHEFGHTIQSLILGPFYLPLVGAVSAIWCNLPYFRRMRKERGLAYTHCFVERWASCLGSCLLKEAAL